MARVTIEAWKCDVCAWTWIPESTSEPARCPSRQCRSSRWNAGKIERPKPEKMIILKPCETEKPRAQEIESPKPAAREIPAPAEPRKFTICPKCGALNGNHFRGCK